jgi:hypothetical protein
VVLWEDWAGSAEGGGIVADQLGVGGDLCCYVRLWVLDVAGGGGVLLDEVVDLLFVDSCCWLY